MNNRLDFLKSRNVILSLIFVFLFVCSSYAFGYFNNSTRIESAMLNLHDVALSDKNSDFLHAEFYGKVDDVAFVAGDAIDYIDTANSVDTSKTILNPYCYLSDGGVKKTFTVSCGGYIFSTECSISGIHLYSDGKVMQNLSLPLFRTEGNVYRLNNGRNGADFGCYIPNTLAAKMLDEWPAIRDFDELIDSAQTIEIINGHDLPKTKFSINNIYFVGKGDKGWDEDDEKEYRVSFGDYNIFFSAFNPTTLFVPIYDSLPNEEVTFCCDLKDGYGALSVFVNNVISTSFSKDGFELRFFSSPTKQVVHDLGAYANGAFFTNEFYAVLFLLLSIVLIAASFAFSLFSLRNASNFKQSVTFLASIFFVFALFWCLPYFVSLFGIDGKYFTYLWLNKIGNEIILIGSLLILGGLNFFAAEKKQ